MTEADGLRDVLAERGRQDAKWGEQDHDPFTYLTVLIEEVGEFAQAALHARFGGKAAEKLREEAVHSAAVALAIVECIDRGKWKWPDAALADAAFAAAEQRAQELYEDRNRHMNKWQADRQSVMSIVPGYEYKNRVDDPEWEKALERLHAALADAAPEPSE